MTDSKINAVYTESPENNPFLEALPPLLTKRELFSKIMSIPESPKSVQNKSERERRRALQQLSAIFLPMDYMYDMYDTVCRVIEST